MESPLIAYYLAGPVLIACAGFFLKLATDPNGDLHQKRGAMAMVGVAVATLFIAMVKIANFG